MPGNSKKRYSLSLAFLIVAVCTIARHNVSIYRSLGATTTTWPQSEGGTSFFNQHQQTKVTLFDPIYNANITNPWKVALYQRLDRIRLACGKICRINTIDDFERYTIPVKNSAINMLEPQPVNCRAILSLDEIDESDHSIPDIPDEIRKYYTLMGDSNNNNNGIIKIRKYKKRSDIFLGKSSETKLWPTGSVWESGDIEKAIKPTGSSRTKWRTCTSTWLLRNFEET